MSAPLPTPAEVEGMRERHVAYEAHGITDCDECGTAWPCDAARLLALVDSMHSWAGLMALMDEHWPSDIFVMGDEPPTGPGDPGPRILALARWVDVLQARLTAVLAACDGADADPLRPRQVHIDRIRRAATGEAT